MSDPESHDAPVIPLRPWAFDGPTHHADLGDIDQSGYEATYQEARDDVAALLDEKERAGLAAGDDTARRAVEQLAAPLRVGDRFGAAIAT